ncbi:MAG TPA: prepilin-type N-terminal cleavage/methylation domain-containing protein [Verrucomicrobiae bacterium]|nr:prepilin-type N-terminal cleavage/methylation domain-containing protein [Verrucomicrobiae bacterium]
MSAVKNAHGFTLIELLIVVAIIGILAAIGIPQYSFYRLSGFNASGLTTLKNFKSAMEAYYGDNGVYP